MLHNFEIFPSTELQKKYLVEKIVIKYETEKKSITTEKDRKIIENVFRQEILDSQIMFSYALQGSRIAKKLEVIRESICQKLSNTTAIIYLSCERVFPEIYSGTRRIDIYFSL